MDPRVDPRGRARPESDSEGEKEFQESREHQPPEGSVEPPPVPSLAWAGSISEGPPNVAIWGGPPV